MSNWKRKGKAYRLYGQGKVMARVQKSKSEYGTGKEAIKPTGDWELKTRTEHGHWLEPAFFASKEEAKQRGEKDVGAA